MKNRYLYFTLIMILCMAAPMLLFAQGPEDPDDPAPIDGGLSILLAAGAAYGVKKYREGKKKKKEI